MLSASHLQGFLTSIPARFVDSSIVTNMFFIILSCGIMYITSNSTQDVSFQRSLQQANYFPLKPFECNELSKFFHI